MENLLKIAAAWDGRMLEELRLDAALEETGNAFSAVRLRGGLRICLAVCATGFDQILRMRQDVDFVDDLKHEDWNTLSLGTLVRRALASPAGVVFEPLSGGGDEWMALVQVAVLPDSIRRLEAAFGLEPN